MNDWARACGWFMKGDRSKPNKQAVYRVAKSAEKAKLLQKSGRTYALIKAGRAILKKDSTGEDEEE
jgi:hypothetical protein